LLQHSTFENPHKFRICHYSSKVKETSCFTSGISGTVKGMAAFFLMYSTKASTV
jgi:hypothetical protein